MDTQPLIRSMPFKFEGNASEYFKIWIEKIGGPCRGRTYDLGIKSPLLYQLS